MPRIRFLVSGDVQGVGFRYFTLERARSLGVSGWVRNRWDGKVEGEAEGSEAALAEFGRELRRGPVSAQVDAVQIHEIPAMGERPVFRIEP
ncbi:MAG TPA: acylphosphatase [Fibrobacteria bacterium]|nr:acylphosphatase [Fibrobacteria bacterium]